MAGCGIVPLLWFRQPERTPALAYAVELLPQAVEQMQATLRENAGGPLEGRFFRGTAVVTYEGLFAFYLVIIGVIGLCLTNKKK